MNGSSASERFPIFWALALVLVALLHFRVSIIGWENRNLPGLEFRQAQTAISALFIQQENNFSLAYPTPVLGKPWSIPMEFPLYQWSVVGVSELTGVPLTQSARGVSLACFYLTVPALGLFLRRIGFSPGQVCIALIAVLSCPLYIFYGRAFLIETMALMFSAWFALGFFEAMRTRSWNWAIAASICAALAGMVKVTTLIVFLLPTAIWGAVELFRALRSGNRSEFGKTLAWGLTPMLFPALCTVAWTRFADGVKAAHPQAAVLMSDSMTQFNFGYGLFDVRFKPETWKSIFGIIDNGLLAWPILAGVLVAWFFIPRGWRFRALAPLALFALAPFVFPLLYAWHDYYFVANAWGLLLFVGCVIAGLREIRFGRWIAPIALAGLLTGQAATYHGDYFKQQSLRGANGPKLSFILQKIVKPDEVIVIIGDDWNSMIPYYAERRALMIRRSFENDMELIRGCLENLREEKIGALVLMREQRENTAALVLAAEEIAVSPHHYFSAENADIYPSAHALDTILPDDVRAREDASPLDMGFVSIGHRLKDQRWRFADLTRRDQQEFELISPSPDEFYFQFGPGLINHDNVSVLNAHPEVKLWFCGLGDPRKVRIEAGLADGAWQHETYPSDGVSVHIIRVASDGNETEIHRRDIEPHLRPEDQGTQSWEIELPTLHHSDTLLVRVGPGPRGSGSTDWFYLESLTIK